MKMPQAIMIAATASKPMAGGSIASQK